MEQIEHKYIEVNELKINAAEIGNDHSPAVVLLHGFPEIWYKWRYQMIAVAKAGYRAIAPDFRGYGLSDHSPQPEKTTFLDLVNDLLALLDAVNIFKTSDLLSFPILSLSMKKRVSGFIVMGVPYYPQTPIEFKGLPEGFYVSRLGEPGRAEADFGRFDAKTVVRKVSIMFSGSEITIANEDQEIMDIVQPGSPLPPWFTEEDLAAYGALYENSGFKTALQVPHRSLAEQLNIPDLTVHVPALFIMGLKDYVHKFPGMEDYISNGGLKSLAPNMEIAPLREGNPFVHEQLPDEVNQHVIDFLTKNCEE